MKQLLILSFLLCLCTCTKQNKDKKPPDLKVLNYDSDLKKTNYGWFYKEKAFSGYMIQAEKDGRIVYESPIIEGKENGLAKGTYNSGEKLLEQNFINGKVEGEFKQWWPNGRIRYLFHYKNDKFDGSLLVFFPNGKKREESNYQLGEKEGVQRVWSEKGLLISNYTIKKKQ